MLINMMQHLANPQSTKAENKQIFKGRPFYIFGFDILIDENLKSWLLEINETPSFNILVCKEAKWVGCKHENCPVSQVDLHVKRTVLTDVLALMFASREQNINTFGNRFGQLTKIYPPTIPAYSGAHDNMRALRDFFYSLADAKDPYRLSLATFERFHKHPHMKKCGVQRANLHIIF